jgi:hypothetical protein
MDIIGKAGDPKLISGDHIHITPILISYEEKAD